MKIKALKEKDVEVGINRIYSSLIILMEVAQLTYLKYHKIYKTKVRVEENLLAREIMNLKVHVGVNLLAKVIMKVIKKTVLHRCNFQLAEKYLEDFLIQVLLIKEILNLLAT